MLDIREQLAKEVTVKSRNLAGKISKLIVNKIISDIYKDETFNICNS